MTKESRDSCSFCPEEELPKLQLLFNYLTEVDAFLINGISDGLCAATLWSKPGGISVLTGKKSLMSIINY